MLFAYHILFEHQFFYIQSHFSNIARNSYFSGATKLGEPLQFAVIIV